MMSLSIFSGFLPIILIVVFVYLGYTIYASFKYKKNFFRGILFGIAIGFGAYLVFYIIGIGLLRRIDSEIGNDVIYNSYI
ncbi:MAG: hypothetical protein AAB649_07255, partial [Patescibacteria group bacterium]